VPEHLAQPQLAVPAAQPLQALFLLAQLGQGTAVLAAPCWSGNPDGMARDARRDRDGAPWMSRTALRQSELLALACVRVVA
jgi:hypothetical protein